MGYMGYDKAYYEKLISETQLFTDDCRKDSAAFRRESYKLVEHLYCYLLAQNQKKYEVFGCEIAEVAIRCINNYSPEKGQFLFYFNAAWKLEYNHISGNQAVNDRLHGIKITDSENRMLKRYIRYKTSLGENVSNAEARKAIAELMDLPVENVEELEMLAEYHACDNEIRTDEEEQTDLFDQLSDGHLIEEAILTEDSVRDILSIVEQVFLTLQQRQKPIVSDMMTIRTASVIVEMGLNTSGYSFINNEILQSYSRGTPLPTQRAIANKYEKNEASVSRSVKEFINKLGTAIKQEE